ncbi:TIGR03663 family protein [Fontisphaera persica]|uniref:flippase activity-associated protein Agl23 n=1 Tax=Fontisphaera persica TaxID=2974023 RepID=UPI0024C0ADE6|nr:flippase activity-associated protein Agl23 [Fontisphaera persica]WCJ58980.1 TIGR03663 family protein [Fontisphaera persica]
MNGWLTRALLLLLAAGAMGLRLPQLDRRPLHNDEGVNAWILRGLVEKGEYRYNPEEFHGPTLHYISLPFVLAASPEARMSDANLRVAPVVFGALLILLLAWLADGLGRVATVTAGVLLAISPAFVFYSRYFIHEIFLIFFTFLALGAGWRYVQTRRWPWAMACGAGIGLMYATKETFVFQVAAAMAGVAMARWWLRRAGTAEGTPRPWWNPRHGLLAAGACLLAAGLFFTSFFTHPRGLLDAVLTYEHWISRAGGASPLIKPWYYYLEHLCWWHPPRSHVWTEGSIVLLALVGTGAVCARRLPAGVSPALGLFLVVYTAVLLFIYTAIPYKTPWCLLVFHQGLILLAGIGVAFLWQWARARWAKAVLIVLLAGMAGHLLWQAWRAAVPVAYDRTNPYVHSQTIPNIFELVQKVKAVAAVHPEGTNMLIKVVSPTSVWPLPWYLREFGRIGWWEEMPADPYAPVMLINASLGAELDEKSNKQYLMVGLFGLRPPARRNPPDTFLEMYVEYKLWERYVMSLPRHRGQDE